MRRSLIGGHRHCDIIIKLRAASRGLACPIRHRYRTRILFLLVLVGQRPLSRPNAVNETRLVAPQQERSRRTLERIEEAALALIAEQGVEATSVQDIVVRARSSVGSFYARFPGKEDLLVHLEQRIWTAARARFDQALEEWQTEGLTLTGLLEPLVELVLRSLREDVRQRRTLDLRASNDDRGSGVRAFHAYILSRIRPLLLARESEILHPIPERAVDLGFAAVVGALQVLERGTLEEGARAGLTDESVVHEMARLYRSYLGGGRPPGEAPPQMEFFDIWE